MWVQSEVGLGSRFHFTASFAVVTGQEASHGPVEPPDVHGLRILVVDDNSTHRDILREMLTNWRMRPTVVGSTAEALEEVARADAAGSPFAVALLDAVMPAPDGFALAEQMAERSGDKPARVMMLTSALRPASIERCRAAGAAATVMKPIKQSELLDVLLGVVSAGRAPPRQAAGVPRDGEGCRGCRRCACCWRRTRWSTSGWRCASWRRRGTGCAWRATACRRSRRCNRTASTWC